MQKNTFISIYFVDFFCQSNITAIDLTSLLKTRAIYKRVSKTKPLEGKDLEAAPFVYLLFRILKFRN